jgi:two-component system nitrate/nitrite response regulator NarL
MAIRVVLADDHPIYRDGVARTLAEAGIDVVGQAQDGEAAVAMTQGLRPDLVLLDISMPKGGGIGALTQIMQMQTPPLTAMLTASEEEGDLLQALRLGAAGYILKGVGEPGPLDDLSRREEDILKLVAQGLSNKEVGRKLALQEKTVKHYMTSILHKLQVRNRVEAAMLARQHLKD